MNMWFIHDYVYKNYSKIFASRQPLEFMVSFHELTNMNIIYGTFAGLVFFFYCFTFLTICYLTFEYSSHNYGCCLLIPDEYSLRSGNYGVVQLKRYGTTGGICEAFWNNNNSDVLCRQLGFGGGKAAFYRRIGAKKSTSIAPILATSYQCNGTESSLSKCVEKDPFICYSSLSAGAICYQYSGTRNEQQHK